MYEKRTQISVAAFSNAEKSRLAAAGDLSWNQAQPGCHLPSILESAGVADSSDQGRGCEQTNARDGLQALYSLVRAAKTLDHCINTRYPLLQIAEVLEELGDQFAGNHRQIVLGIAQHVRHFPANRSGPARKDYPVFS
jgi:hypothetical protein